MDRRGVAAAGVLALVMFALVGVVSLTSDDQGLDLDAIPEGVSAAQFGDRGPGDRWPSWCGPQPAGGSCRRRPTRGGPQPGHPGEGQDSLVDR